MSQAARGFGQCGQLGTLRVWCTKSCSSSKDIQPQLGILFLQVWLGFKSHKWSATYWHQLLCELDLFILAACTLWSSDLNSEVGEEAGSLHLKSLFAIMSVCLLWSWSKGAGSHCQRWITCSVSVVGFEKWRKMRDLLANSIRICRRQNQSWHSSVQKRSFSLFETNSACWELSSEIPCLSR